MIWRIGNLDVNKEVQYVVLICGTNNIDKNAPAEIVKGMKYAIQLVKFYNCKIIVLGILTWDYSPDIRRNKIRLVNSQIKYAVGKMNKNDVTYINPDHTWTGGTLDTNLYYKDNLHLVKKENEKLAKAITTAFDVGALKQQQDLPQIGQQNQQEHSRHQEGQKHQEGLQKHQKDQPKPKHQQHQIERQLPQEEIRKQQVGQQQYQQQCKQHKYEQLKQYQKQQQQQKQQH